MFVKFNERLAALDLIKECVKSIPLLGGKVDDLLALKPAIEKVKAFVQEVVICAIFDKYDALLAQSTSRDAAVTALSSQVASLESQVNL